MWIKYICLENFKNILTGLKADRLEIDFSKRRNVICLITGPNGMGKTSLLSYLTPFATVGNLDIRENNQLILDKRPGYKRIIIMNGSDEIDIEHFYSPNKNSHSVKSYFKLNGNELNPNGNVSSFKAVVSEILHIDMDYLKLLRLGDNVVNLIRLKSSERKSFMSKMLPSVDNYLKYYTKLTADVRDLKVVMSHIIDKMNKLNIEDEKVYSLKIKEIEDAVNFYEDSISKLTEEIHELEFNIKNLELPDEYKMLIKGLQKKEEKYKKILEKKDTLDDLSTIKSLLKEINDKINYSEVKLEFTEEELKKEIDLLDSLMKDLKELKDQYARERNNSQYESIKEYLKNILEERRNMHLDMPFSPDFTKEELDSFVVDLKNIQHDLNITYEFGRDPIRDVIKMMKDNINIKDYITSSMISIESGKNPSNKTYLDTLVDKYSKLPKPSCDKNCILMNLYNDVMRVKDLKPVNEVNRTSEYYQMMNIVHDNMLNIIQRFQELGEFIKRLPIEYQTMFSKKIIFKRISSCEIIYDDKKINDLMMYMGEYDKVKTLDEEIKNTQEKLEKEKLKNNMKYFEEKILQTNNMIEEKTNIIDEKRILIEDMRNSLQEYRQTLITLEDSIGALEDYEEVKSELDTLITKEESYNSFSNTKMVKLNELNQIQSKKTFLLSECNKMKNSLVEYNNLQTDLEKCKELYDNFVLAKSATSTKEGLPLLHIQMYLKDTKDLANELLDIVYDENSDEKIQISDFDISADEFKIPYIKNGIEIPDISYASQGEQSFLNIAISFALSIQNLTEYNIPLLDEVDATFDQKRRERAIEVIEKQNELINSQQTFVISHNNMYDQYPVDVLDFADLENSIFDVKLS